VLDCHSGASEKSLLTSENYHRITESQNRITNHRIMYVLRCCCTGMACCANTCKNSHGDFWAFIVFCFCYWN